MHLISVLINPFVWHPELIIPIANMLLVVSIVFYLFRRRAWPCLVASVVWGLFAMHEQHCIDQGLNIRVDLLLIEPIIIIVTLWGFYSAIHPRKRKPSNSVKRIEQDGYF